MGMKWRPYPRDQGKFIAIRDGTNLAEVFANIIHLGRDDSDTLWVYHLYQAHPDQLKRIEDNFDMFYRNLLEEEAR